MIVIVSILKLNCLLSQAKDRVPNPLCKIYPVGYTERRKRFSVNCKNEGQNKKKPDA
jgi:hypothetical protein